MKNENSVPAGSQNCQSNKPTRLSSSAQWIEGIGATEKHENKIGVDHHGLIVEGVGRGKEKQESEEEHRLITKTKLEVFVTD